METVGRWGAGGDPTDVESLPTTPATSYFSPSLLLYSDLFSGMDEPWNVPENAKPPSGKIAARGDIFMSRSDLTFPQPMAKNKEGARLHAIIFFCRER